MTMTFASREAAVRRPDIALSILGFALVVLGVISVAAVKQRRVKSASTAPKSPALSLARISN
jgi:hypothetical protein